MARVSGPSRRELDARGDEFAARVSRAIRTTLRNVAPSTRTVDDLARIQTIWRSVVNKSLAPHLRDVWNIAVQGVRVQLEKLNERDSTALVAAVFEIPQVANPLAETFLAEATNRLVAIGDVVWYTARGEMLAGMQLGEGVAELRERVVLSANVSEKRAEVIARTEVNSAMNNGAYEQMKALNVATIKEWIATNDSRTRESHEEVDGEEIDGDAKFMVGGYAMDHPHDLNAPPSQTINCRCTLAWEIVDDEDDYEDDLVAAGVYEEAKHPRDNKGKFAKKPGGGASKKLKITHMLVHKNHGEAGTILTENGAGDKRVVWDGKEYRLQSKTGDDKWTTDKKVKKSKAYVEINAYDADWREPKSADTGKDSKEESSTKKPLAPTEHAPDITEDTPPDNGPVTGLGPPVKSMGDLTKIKSHKKGGIFNDAHNVLWNVQPMLSESHARNQFLAANLYNFAGVPVEHTDLVEIDPGKIPGGSGVGIKTVYAPTTAGIVDTMTTSASAQKQVNENFAIDAWLGNWDVVGLGYENLSVDKYGNVQRTNIGGSLLYRANGQPKGAAFGDKVTEIDSLRNPHVNPASAKVFANVTDDDIRAGVAKLENMSPNIIDFVVEQSGFTGAEATKLKHTLKARRQDLIDKYGSNAPKPSVPDVPATSSQPTASNALGGTKTYTASQKAKVQSIFAKHNLKWFNKTNAIYDAAHEVSTTHSDLTMADALDIMDQSLQKKSGNPFRTKVEKWLGTKAGKQHALAKGGSASLGGTAPATSPVPSATPITSPSKSTNDKYVDHGGVLPQKLTRTTAGILQQRMDNDTPPPWSAAQKAALRKYTGGDYTTINKCARGTAPCSDETKKILNHINAAMKPSTDDVVLYRKTNPKSFGVESGEDLKAMIGKTISDDGVISTSITSGMWSGQLSIEIEAPKGSMMGWVQPISLHPGENEMVVAPGTHYEVISVEKHPYYESYTVKLRIIPGSDAQSRTQAEQLKTQQAIAELKAAKELASA